MSNQKIEALINEVLKGGSRKNALDFVAYLHDNEMIVGENHSEVSYNGESICYMHIDGSDQAPGPWTIWSDDNAIYEHGDASLDEHTKEIAWARANVCGSCGGDCSPGKHKTIFDKEFDNICSSTFMFTNPDAETLECVKKLLAMRKKAMRKSNA